MPLFETRCSVALVHAVVDVRHGHLRLDVVDPVVVDRVGLSGPARPTTAAASPLATMVANPNFFILGAFFSLCSACLLTLLTDLAG